MVAPPVQILASLLSADFARLAEEIQRVEEAGADGLHVDVMDGHFVPNLTIGPPVVKAIAAAAGSPVDLHLMIEAPSSWVERFAEARPRAISYHVEAEPDGFEVVRRAGAQAGVAISPGTEIERVRELLPRVDRVLVMSVEPGFGGQSFRPDVLPKIEALRSWGWTGDVAVDGGIDVRTIEAAAAAGANVFVSGSGIFGSQDPAGTIARMRELAAKALASRGLDS